jgi:hypothetical protein
LSAGNAGPIQSLEKEAVQMVTKRQARTSISKLQSGLVFCGEVTGIRQTYYVLKAEGFFLVLSFALPESKRASGYFNLVEEKAVDYVCSRFAGEKAVTAKDVVARARRTTHAPTNLVALNILYVLVATGAAKIERTGEHQQLVFSVRQRATRTLSRKT